MRLLTCCRWISRHENCVCTVGPFFNAKRMAMFSRILMWSLDWSLSIDLERIVSLVRDEHAIHKKRNALGSGGLM